MKMNQSMFSSNANLPKGFIRLEGKKPIPPKRPEPPKLLLPLLPLRPSCKNDNWCIPPGEKKRLSDKLREAVLFRDSYTCRYCGHYTLKGRYMNMHHVSSNKDTIDNLVTCCVACHAVQHFGFNLMKQVIEIWKSPFSQLEIVRMTRKAFKEGKTLESVKKRLKLKEDYFEPSSIEFANLIRKNKSKDFCSYLDTLDPKLRVIFVAMKRWQID